MSSALLTDMQFGLAYAETHQVAVVVVVPASRHQEALDAIVAVAGIRLPFSGCQARVPTGGSLAVRMCLEPVPENAFVVLFTGWGATIADSEEMVRWRNAARQVISRIA